jgi:hypothetical protein
MSARITRSAAATVAASALLGSAALAFPAAANAATPAQPALRMSLTVTAPGAALQPGGAARTEIFKVTNNGSKSQKFTGELLAFGDGAVFAGSGALKESVTALGRTPATATTILPQTPGLVGGFYPKGTKWGLFTIPAHTTFSWKISTAATKAFPLNDKGVDLRVGLMGPGDTAPAYVDGFIKVGSGRTGGVVNEYLWGDASLSLGHPAYDTLKVVNRTGAYLNAWQVQPWIMQARGAQLATDVWVGSPAKGHWQQFTGALNAGDLANGHAKWFKLRIRVVSYTTKNPAVWDEMFIENHDGFSLAPTQELMVRRG